jgi:hypothetical protein
MKQRKLTIELSGKAECFFLLEFQFSIKNAIFALSKKINSNNVDLTNYPSGIYFLKEIKGAWVVKLVIND